MNDEILYKDSDSIHVLNQLDKNKMNAIYGKFGQKENALHKEKEQLYEILYNLQGQNIGYHSRSISLAITKLEECIFWLKNYPFEEHIDENVNKA